ncbi:unnamed protein product, partial [Allacma fusca]
SCKRNMAGTICGFTLQKIIIILAILDLISESVGAYFTCSVLARVVNLKKTLVNSSSDSSDKQEEISEASSAIALLSINVALYATQIALCILLLLGAFQKSKVKCRIWWQFSAAILFIAFISVILNSFFGTQSSIGTTLLALTPQMLLFIYKGYMIVMVYSFIKNLRFSNTTNYTATYEDEYDQVDLN